MVESINVDDSIQNSLIKRQLYRKSAELGIPLAVNFELSPICNFDCSICYIHQTPEQVKNHPREMTRLEEWLSLAEQLKANGTLYILLTGGEPLLWPDFWNLYEQLVKMGFLVSVNTNGSLIDDSVIGKFEELPPNSINITLYGASDDTYFRLCKTRGVYRRVTSSIIKLKQKRIPVRLNCSFTPDNVNDLKQIINFAKMHEIEVKPTAYIFPPVRTKAEMIGNNQRFTPMEAAECYLNLLRITLDDNSFLKSLKRIAMGIEDINCVDEECIPTADGTMACMAGKASCWISWDGYLMLCGMLPNIKVDLKKLCFFEAWENLKTASQSVLLSGICSGCSNRKACGVCAAKAYTETGNIEGTPKYLCNLVESLKQLAITELKDYNCNQQQ